MILLATSAFALALVAAVCGVLALTISWRLTRAHERRHTLTRNEYAKFIANAQLLHRRVSDRLRELEGQTPAKLAAEVAALSDAVSRVADTHRRFAGKVWAEIGQARPKQNGVANGDTEDDELAAMLALQKAGPAPPA